MSRFQYCTVKAQGALLFSQIVVAAALVFDVIISQWKTFEILFLVGNTKACPVLHCYCFVMLATAMWCMFNPGEINEMEKPL
jgi:hypothetical protein